MAFPQHNLVRKRLKEAPGEILVADSLAISGDKLVDGQRCAD